MLTRVIGAGCHQAGLIWFVCVVQQQGQTGSASSQPGLLHMPHRQSPLHQASSASSSSSSSSALSVGQLVSSKCSVESEMSKINFQPGAEPEKPNRGSGRGKGRGVLAPKPTCTKFIAVSTVTFRTTRSFSAPHVTALGCGDKFCRRQLRRVSLSFF